MYAKLSETIGTRTAGDQLFKLVIISTNNFKLPTTHFQPGIKLKELLVE